MERRARQGWTEWVRAPLGWEESAQLAVLADLDGLGLVARGSRVEGLEVLLATTTHDHDLCTRRQQQEGMDNRGLRDFTSSLLWTGKDLGKPGGRYQQKKIEHVMNNPSNK